MSPADRRAFLECVETHLQNRADPNMTICVYGVGKRILHRVLNDNDLQGFDLSFVDTTDLVQSEKAQLLYILTPFLESLLQEDIDIIVLFLRHGVNARDLTRHFNVVKSCCGINNPAGLLSISHIFQSVRGFVKNVDILQDMSLQTWLIKDILRTLMIINKYLIITYNGRNMFNAALKAEVHRVTPEPVSGTIWNHFCVPLTAGCPHARDQISDRTQGTSEASRASSSVMCSMCQLVVGHRQHITAYPMPRPKVFLGLQHIAETQRWELISRFNETERRHTVRSVPCM